MKLAHDAQNTVSENPSSEGAEVARQALAVFGIETNPNWRDRLSRSSLTQRQKDDVQEAAFETLVGLADDGVRWNKARANDPQVARDSLVLLDRASSFHETAHRPVPVVRRDAYRQLKDEQAAKDADTRFQAMPAKTAWDWFLPGHSAGWTGDLELAIRSYQAALRVQPDHYPSLLFLAVNLSDPRINRLPEAIAYSRACSVARPRSHTPTNCARHYERLAKREEAETERSAAISAADDDLDRSVAYLNRGRSYQSLGRLTLADEDFKRAEAAARDAIRTKPGDAYAHLFLGRALRLEKSLDKAIIEFQEAVRLSPKSSKVRTSRLAKR